jgi:hypothetical protein
MYNMSTLSVVFLSCVIALLAYGHCSLIKVPELEARLTKCAQLPAGRNPLELETENLDGLEELLTLHMDEDRVDPVCVCRIFAKSPLIREPVFNEFLFYDAFPEEEYPNYLKCLQYVGIRKWNNSDAHFYLAFSYRRKWYDKDMWLRSWLSADFKTYQFCLLGAGNEQLLTDISAGLLPGASRMTLTTDALQKSLPSIMFHDSVTTVKFFLQNLISADTLGQILRTEEEMLFETGAIKILQYVHQNGVDINWSLVDLAAEYDRLQVVRSCYENVHILPSVKTAARKGFLEIVRFVVEAAPDRIPSANGAAQNGHVAVLQYLYSKDNVHVDANSLSLATMAGYVEIVRLVYQFEAKLPEPTAIDIAAQRGYLNIITFVHSIDPTLLPSRGAMRAARKNRHNSLVSFVKQERKSTKGATSKK